MMYNEEYKNDIEKLYDCQKNEDIAAINELLREILWEVRHLSYT